MWFKCIRLQIKGKQFITSYDVVKIGIEENIIEIKVLRHQEVVFRSESVIQFVLNLFIEILQSLLQYNDLIT